MDKTFSLDKIIYMDDTDMTGVVYHANYLKYFEHARTAWLSSYGISQLTVQEKGYYFVIAEAKVQYKRPLQLHDKISISCEPELARPTAVLFKQSITTHESQLLTATGKILVVVIDRLTFKPVPVPPDILEIL